MTRGLVVQAGDFLTWQQTRPGLMPEVRTAYVERVCTRDGQSRPRWWPGFRLVLRSAVGETTTVDAPPRGAREADAAEVREYRALQDAYSPALPIGEVLTPTRVYAAPAEQAALF
ncbi:MAG TPA: hypothetical protein VIL55_11675 [Naasia sp.]